VGKEEEEETLSYISNDKGSPRRRWWQAAQQQLPLPPYRCIARLNPIVDLGDLLDPSSSTHDETKILSSSRLALRLGSQHR